jgi:hypothetical protein
VEKKCSAWQQCHSGPNVRWERLKDAIVESAIGTIGYIKGRRIKKPWITADMVDKMDMRRQWKNNNSEEGKKRYRELNNELRRETDKARKVW